MKLKSIISICKKEKRIVLFNRTDEEGEVAEQWIGDGVACYRVGGLPILDQHTVAAIFDIPAKDEEKWDIRQERLPKGPFFEDIVDDEEQLEEYGLSIGFLGVALKPLRTHRGETIFIDARYLSPLSDSLDSLFLHRRRTVGGLDYVAVKVGFALEAVIAPCRVETEKFIEKLSRLAREVEATNAPEVDEETGEVIA